MSLLTAGYFPTTYWAEDYFTDDFWQDYGAPHILKVFMIRDAGTPTTGLSPIIDLFIKALDGSNVTPVPGIQELGGGYYKFGHDVAQDTVVRVDTGDAAMVDADRYIDVGVITPYDDAIDRKLSDVESSIPTVGEIRTEMEGAGHTLATIKDNLDIHDQNIKAFIFAEY